MDFQLIKPVVQQALSLGTLTSAEEEVVLNTVMSDKNQDRASLLVELLGLPRNPAAKAS
ncbi:MAG: hypothetical protein AAF268_07865 [Cyanobacteria bacterium P01_A01_bin.3]